MIVPGGFLSAYSALYFPHSSVYCCTNNDKFYCIAGYDKVDRRHTPGFESSLAYYPPISLRKLFTQHLWHWVPLWTCDLWSCLHRHQSRQTYILSPSHFPIVLLISLDSRPL